LARGRKKSRRNRSGRRCITLNHTPSREQTPRFPGPPFQQFRIAACFHVLAISDGDAAQSVAHRGVRWETAGSACQRRWRQIFTVAQPATGRGMIALNWLPARSSTHSILGQALRARGMPLPRAQGRKSASCRPVSKPSISVKCRLWLNTAKPCWRAVAAIQRSLVGIGLPLRRNPW